MQCEFNRVSYGMCNGMAITNYELFESTSMWMRIVMNELNRKSKDLS
jgi:hypothetical protein